MANCYEKLLSFAEMTELEPLFDCGSPPPTASSWTQDFTVAQGDWIRHKWASYVPNEGWRGGRSPGRTVFRLEVGVLTKDYSFPVNLIRLTVFNWWRREGHDYPELAVSLAVTNTGNTMTEIHRSFAPVATAPTNQFLTIEIPVAATISWGVRVWLANTNQDEQPVYLKSIEVL